MRPTLLRQSPEPLPSFSQTVTARLRDEARRQGISVARLATASGVPVGKLRRTFTGHRPALVVEVFELAKALGIEDLPGIFRIEPGQKFGPEQ